MLSVRSVPSCSPPPIPVIRILNLSEKSEEAAFSEGREKSVEAGIREPSLNSETRAKTIAPKKIITVDAAAARKSQKKPLRIRMDRYASLIERVFEVPECFSFVFLNDTNNRDTDRGFEKQTFCRKSDYLGKIPARGRADYKSHHQNSKLGFEKFLTFYFPKFKKR